MTTLYHASSEANANSIMASGRMIASNGGWLGPAVYFADSPGSANQQAVDGYGPHEAIIVARVNLGRVWYVASSDSSLNLSRVNAAGYDTVCHSGGGYTQYAVYEVWRITVIEKTYYCPYTPPEPKRAPARGVSNEFERAGHAVGHAAEQVGRAIGRLFRW
jgi:hypothetical protein